MHVLYADAQRGHDSLTFAEKELFLSIERSYDVYLWYLKSLSDLLRYAQEKIESGSKKRLPSFEDLNPNKKFVTNQVLHILANSESLFKAADNRKISWFSQPEMLKQLFEEVKHNRIFAAYLDNPEKSFEDDKAFIAKLFKNIIANFEPFHQFVEETSIYLVDDIDLVCSMVIKNLKAIEQDKPFELLNLYYGEDQKEEEAFAKTLLRKTLLEEKMLSSLINEKTKNWELDRIALLDMVIMKMAIIEAIHFESIPTKVTLNEFIDLAKFYSTPKSSNFINGVLDRIFEELKAKGTIKKVGRGLKD